MDLQLASFGKRVLLVTSFAVLAVLFLTFFRIVSHVFLYLMASGMAALVVSAAFDKITARLRISRQLLAVLTALFVLLPGLTLTSVVVLPRFSAQMQAIELELTNHPGVLRGALQSTVWSSQAQVRLEELRTAAVFPEDGWWNRFPQAFASSIGLIFLMLLACAFSLLVAANPTRFTGFLFRTLPEQRRKTASTLSSELKLQLTRWAHGRIVTALLVFTCSYVGLWLIGTPYCLTIAVFSALVSVIPVAGALISALVAIYIGLLQGIEKAFCIMLLYMAIQACESCIIVPWFEERTVALPVAWVVVVEVVLGAMLGLPALFLAAPLTIVLRAFVRLAYVKEHAPRRLQGAGPPTVLIPSRQRHTGSRRVRD